MGANPPGPSFALVSAAAGGVFSCRRRNLSERCPAILWYSAERPGNEGASLMVAEPWGLRMGPKQEFQPQ